jgi:prephenate dehydrogenase
MHLNTVVIIGVGLIGGSLGLAIRASGIASRIIGVGRDARNLARSVAQRAIDLGTTDLTEACRDADLVVVCTPVDRVAEDVLAALAVAPSRCVVTDVGSTKCNIVRKLKAHARPEAAPFVGSHPLAGSEKRGSAHAREDLFRDRVVVLTPTSETDLEAVAVVEYFWQALGAKIVRMDPESHDWALAVTSHLPHAVASAIAGSTPLEWLPLTAGGFRDSTRIAAGDAELWAAIFEANREAVLSASRRFLEQFAQFQTALEQHDHALLVNWLREGKRIRDALGS